ncbi:hypothetical protein HanHA300_Chr13g0495801 [Helianthus annuus]|nr:hypothetical protein HanHA300_Chr13g0495801 [Helianthus annuus]KAJ0498931.1 hypothetical protein HanHA89_Chr13g0528441 [Helianthus annuus]KAJ0664946.1 hypothetical protein HanLR1_Chr13g0498471 [Helianthus annuus]KAJ0672366.1 hypothetical protein HanOQP8_Chr13g0496441 [Helianthus annuus]
MRTEINNFNNIHNSLVNNYTRRSGSSDVDIMTAAPNEYRIYHGHPFTMIPSWELLRKSSKWHLVPLFDLTTHMSKRPKLTTTSKPSESDARTTINLNDNLDKLHFEDFKSYHDQRVGIEAMQQHEHETPPLQRHQMAHQDWMSSTIDSDGYSRSRKRSMNLKWRNKSRKI